jgi:ACS family pantothenate transporter-like MFS transporter
MGRAEEHLGATPNLDVHSVDAEVGFDGSQEQLVVKPIKSWKGYLWDTWDLPSDQRRLLFKLDAFVLTFASIGYFLKNLDQSNVNNAFLSGMEEDLQMFGNQLVTSKLVRVQTLHPFVHIMRRFFPSGQWLSLFAIGTSIWTVGYVIGQIPSNLLLTRVSPRWVIPSLEVGWGIATICTASVQSYQALYALRFLVGFCE